MGARFGLGGWPEKVDLRELEALAAHALLYAHAEEGHELLAGGRGDAEALRHVRRARAVLGMGSVIAAGHMALKSNWLFRVVVLLAQLPGRWCGGSSRGTPGRSPSP